MDTLEIHNIGHSIITLQEAMSSLEITDKDIVFNFKLPSSEEQIEEETLKDI